jgi:hypothetical protein
VFVPASTDLGPAPSFTVEMESRTFKVLYAKAGAKKRKLFADGVLRIRPGPPPTHVVTLTSDDGGEIAKRTEKGGVVYNVGAEISFGSFVVQIDEEVGEPDSSAGNATKGYGVPPRPQQSAPLPSVKLSKFIRPNSKSFVSSVPQGTAVHAAAVKQEAVSTETVVDDASFWEINEDQSHAGESRVAAPVACRMETVAAAPAAPAAPVAPCSSSSSSNRTYYSFSAQQKASRPASHKAVEQDPALLRVMRPHQVTGADFLISRLLGQAADARQFAREDESEKSAAFSTGAILADEVRIKPKRGVAPLNICCGYRWVSGRL